ncbi:MAG: hypothetical protein KAH21_00485 [Spirochaetaceae bacterium]|nr:hypothetical protein [Spirochaetaceae bacterium]
MGRKHTSKEWGNHVSLWQQSNKSLNAYCRENNLAASSFRYWTGKRKQKLSIHNDVRPLVRINPEFDSYQKTATKKDQGNLTLHINERYHVEIPSPVNKEDLQILLEVVGNLS